MKLFNKAKFKPEIVEYFTGISIITKGFEELPHFGERPFSVSFIFFAGIFIILGARFHNLAAKYLRKPTACFNIIEGTVEIISAVILFKKPTSLIPYFLAFIGLTYLGIGIVRILETPNNKYRLWCIFITWMGIACTIFGFFIISINALSGLHKPPAYILAGLYSISGPCILLFRKKIFKSILKSITALHPEPHN